MHTVLGITGVVAFIAFVGVGPAVVLNYGRSSERNSEQEGH